MMRRITAGGRSGKGELWDAAGASADLTRWVRLVPLARCVFDAVKSVDELGHRSYIDLRDEEYSIRGNLRRAT